MILSDKSWLTSSDPSIRKFREPDLREKGNCEARHSLTDPPQQEERGLQAAAQDTHSTSTWILYAGGDDGDDDGDVGDDGDGDDDGYDVDNDGNDDSSKGDDVDDDDDDDDEDTPDKVGSVLWWSGGDGSRTGDDDDDDDDDTPDMCVKVWECSVVVL